VEGGADALFIVVVAPPEAVAGPHATSALNIVLQTIAMAVRGGAHAMDGILKTSAQADTTLSYTLGADNACAGIGVLRVGDTLTCDALSRASSFLVTERPVPGTPGRPGHWSGAKLEKMGG